MPRLSLRPLVPLTLLLGAAAGCDDSDGPSLVGPGNGVSATVSRVVVQPRVDTIFARDSLLPTDAVQLQAAVISFSGGIADGAKVRWSTPDTGIVTVDSTGVVRPRRLGTATVTATSGNKDDQATVVVAWAAQRLAITSPTRTANAAGVLPTADTIFVRNPVTVQDTRPLRARAIDVDGDTLTGVRYTWSSSNPNVASVDTAGVVRARGVGTATITVRGADLTATRTVNVTSVVREVRVSAPASQVLTQDTLRLTARAIGYDSLPVSDTRLAWTSSNPAVATIDSTGLARFASRGTVRFTATTHFVSGSTGAAPNTADVTVQDRVYLQAEAGDDHTCSVITLGRVYCWGLNDIGQLGATGDTTCFGDGSANAPCSLVPLRATTEVAFARVSTGSAVSCGVATSGRAYCWGDGSVGQLGNGTSGSAPAPTLVTSALSFDTTAGSLSVGGAHACAITASVRMVYCWGSDASGQLGTQRVPVNSTTPIPAELPPFPNGPTPMRWVSAGAAQTCAVASTGQAYCWGRNRGGELGIGVGIDTTVALPSAVLGGLTFASIAAPAAVGGHACGIIADGRAVCWGSNSASQLGTGQPFTSLPATTAPVSVLGDRTYQSLGVGADFTCALGRDAQIYCWGASQFGQLGVANSTGHGEPRPVDTPVALEADGRIVGLGAVSYVALSVGTRHACGLATDGNLYCWGSEVFGPLGSPLQARVQPRPIRVTRPI